MVSKSFNTGPEVLRCSASTVEEAHVSVKGPVSALTLFSAQLLASLLSENVELMADLIFRVARNVLEPVAASLNHRRCGWSRNGHAAVWFFSAGDG